MYNADVILITNIFKELKKLSVAGASDSDNAIIITVKELTAEIRAYYKVYMAVVSLFLFPLNLILLTLLVELCYSRVRGAHPGGGRPTLYKCLKLLSV